MKFAQLCAISALVACSSAPTNFAGNYTVAVTSQANTCGLPNWSANSTSSGIAVTFTQDGSTAQLNVQGLAGLYVAAVAGTSSIQGTVTGDAFTGELLGTKQTMQSTCTYTVNVKVDATLDSKGVLSGTLTYTPVTNGDAACGTLNLCSNTQIVSGNRN